jgi:uncharacterized protein YjbJ (UPF0337 family)
MSLMQTEGNLKQAEGAVRENVGSFFGNDEQQAKGAPSPLTSTVFEHPAENYDLVFGTLCCATRRQPMVGHCQLAPPGSWLVGVMCSQSDFNPY